jgi:hypothetical protein
MKNYLRRSMLVVTSDQLPRSLRPCEPSAEPHGGYQNKWRGFIDGDGLRAQPGRPASNNLLLKSRRPRMCGLVRHASHMRLLVGVVAVLHHGPDGGVAEAISYAFLEHLEVVRVTARSDTGRCDMNGARYWPMVNMLIPWSHASPAVPRRFRPGRP